MSNYNGLAIELSQRDGFVAACSATGEVSELEVQTQQRDTDAVMPAIHQVVDAVGIKPANLQFVGVSIGPGSFTGLRSAVAIAKMIALTTSVSIIAVESAVVAADTLGIEEPLLVVSGVKDESFWLSRVSKEGNCWQCDSGLTDVASLGNALGGVVNVVADSHISESIEAEIKSLKLKLHSLALSGTSLLRISATMFESGETTSPHLLLPLYPREPEAVRKWRELHGAKNKDR